MNAMSMKRLRKLEKQGVTGEVTVLSPWLEATGKPCFLLPLSLPWS